jgi:hypothetical protein
METMLEEDVEEEVLMKSEQFSRTVWELLAYAVHKSLCL